MKIRVPTNLNTDTPGKAVCPHCGEPNDQISGEGKPRHNDIAMCFMCGEPSFIREDMTLRKPTLAEQLQLDGNQTIRSIKLLIEKAKSLSKK